jgi:hypothetical protein
MAQHLRSRRTSRRSLNTSHSKRRASGHVFFFAFDYPSDFRPSTSDCPHKGKRVASFGHPRVMRTSVLLRPCPLLPCLLVLQKTHLVSASVVRRYNLALLPVKIVPQFAAISMHVVSVVPNVAPVVTDIASVVSDVAFVVPNLFCLMASCRRVSVTQVLPHLTSILSQLAPVSADIASIVANVSTIVPNVPAIMSNVADIVSHFPRVRYWHRNLCHRQSAHSQRSRRDPEHHLPGRFHISLTFRYPVFPESRT